MLAMHRVQRLSLQIAVLVCAGALSATEAFSGPVQVPAATSRLSFRQPICSIRASESTDFAREQGGDAKSSRRTVLGKGLQTSGLALILGAASPSWAQISLPGLWQSDDSKKEGYELAPIVKDGKPSPVLLVPVIQAVDDLNKVDEMIRSGKTEAWEEAYKRLAAKPFNPPIELKRILNAYTDNIYFSDSGRKNMYLDGSAMLGAGTSTFGFGTLSVGNGGASPETKDTMTYLYRNEALNNIDALTAELRYLITQRGKGVEESTDDLLKYLKDAKAGFTNYLSTIPQGELKAAEEYVRMKAAK